MSLQINLLKGSTIAKLRKSEGFAYLQDAPEAIIGKIDGAKLGIGSSSGHRRQILSIRVKQH